MPIALAAAGLLTSLLGNAQQQATQEKTAQMQAAQEKAAPWLALVNAKPDNTQTQFAPPVAGAALQGGLGGLAAANSIQQAEQNQSMNQQLLNFLTNKGQTPTAGMPGGQDLSNLNGSSTLQPGSGMGSQFGSSVNSPALTQGIGTQLAEGGIDQNVLSQLLQSQAANPAMLYSSATGF